MEIADRLSEAAENQWTRITFFGVAPITAVDGSYIKRGERCLYRWNVARQRDEWQRETSA